MKTVLFVCVGNSCRSQMAEAFFNLNAPAGWHSQSAGTLPGKKISPVALEVMGEIGIDMSKKKPKPLTPNLLEKADLVISMGCGVDLCPLGVYNGVSDWGIFDPIGQPIEVMRKIRNEIELKVSLLIDEISKEKNKLSFD